MNNEYIDYPFTSNGVNFVSRIYSHSEFAERVKTLPPAIWQDINRNAVEEIVGDVSKMSVSEILKGLERVNEGGSHAFILLGADK